MSKDVFPLIAADVSVLARGLSRELAACPQAPSHVQMLNILARSAGYRNFQHLRAQHMAQAKLEHQPPPPETIDHKRVLRVSRHFDATGQLLRWPKKHGERMLCLWALWSQIPAGKTFSEAEINEILASSHLFGDHALLRRCLCDLQMMARTTDCRHYWRLESRPPADAQALIRHLRLRRAD